MKFLFLLLLILPVAGFAAPTQIQYINMIGEDKKAAIEVANVMCAYHAGWHVVSNISSTMSMWPASDQGCVLIMARKPWEQVDVGDIMSYYHKQRGFWERSFGALHRVIAKYKEGVVCKGDNNKTYDPYILTEQDYLEVVFVVIRFKKIPFGISMTPEDARRVHKDDYSN